MSASPPKETEDAPDAQSGDEAETGMSREQEGTQTQGLGDFEVKEQDRWLPIANGWFPCFPMHFLLFSDLRVPCVTSVTCMLALNNEGLLWSRFSRAYLKVEHFIRPLLQP